MSRVLVLFAHPNPGQSRVNKPMADMAKTLEGVTFVDLYSLYPRYKIDIDAEQQRLIDHDVIVFQFPFYWYSTPSMLKIWQDLVLEHGFAYGQGGNLLAGKSLLIATTAGGAEDAYSVEGSNSFPVRTLLAPLEQTACLCQLRYLAPLVLFSSLAASNDQRVSVHVEQYKTVLESLRDNRLDLNAALSQELLGEPAIPLLTALKGVESE